MLVELADKNWFSSTCSQEEDFKDFPMQCVSGSYEGCIGFPFTVSELMIGMIITTPLSEGISHSTLTFSYLEMETG